MLGAGKGAGGAGVVISVDQNYAPTSSGFSSAEGMAERAPQLRPMQRFLATELKDHGI